jgi:hypothetical protein
MARRDLQDIECHLHCAAFDTVMTELTAQSLERRPPRIFCRLALGVPQQLFDERPPHHDSP